MSHDCQYLAKMSLKNSTVFDGERSIGMPPPEQCIFSNVCENYRLYAVA